MKVCNFLAFVGNSDHCAILGIYVFYNSEEVTHELGKLRRCPMREKKQKVFKRPAVKCG